MRRLMLILLFASSLVVSSQGTSRTSSRRHLNRRNNEERPDQDSYFRRLSSDSNDSNGSDDDGDDDNNIFVQAKSRVDQDFSAMWSSSPSEWSQEYWEVFVGLLSLVLIGSLCACIACIVPLWFPEQQYAAPSKELDDNNEMRNKPINETSESEAHHDEEINSDASWIVPAWLPGQSTSPSKELEDNNVMSNQTSEPGAHHNKEINSKASSRQPNQSNFDQPILAMSNATSDYDTAESPRPRNRPRKERNLYNEVVSVWTEFFAELGLFKERSRQKYNQPYRKYKERHVPDVSAREASSRKTYIAPIPRKLETISSEYDADASSHHEEAPPHKVYKAPSPQRLKAKSSEYDTADASSHHEEEPPHKSEYDTADASSHHEEEPPHKVEKYEGKIV